MTDPNRFPLPDDLKGVLRRRNSESLVRIDRARSSRPAGIHVTGTAASGKTEICHLLTRRDGAEIGFADSVEEAAVVVIVVDASAPVGRADVERWRPAFESTPVVLVVNKIDVHRRWREVVDADIEIVAERVPRAVEHSVHPVSARLARAGREIGDAAVFAESGFGAVADRIDALLMQAAAVGAQRKYVAAVQESAAEAKAAIVAEARAVTGGGDTAPLRARRARLLDERERLGGDRRALLHNRIQRVRVDCIHAAAEDVRMLGAQVRQTIEGSRRAELGHLPGHLAESVQAVRARADAALSTGLRAVEVELGLAGTVPESGTAGGEIDIGEPTRRRGIEDVLMVALGASAGVGLGRLVVSPLALIPTLAVANTIVSLAIGAAIAWWLTRSRALVADRAHLRGWTQESLARVKSDVEQRLLSRILDAESALASALTSADREAAARIDLSLAEIDAELRTLADHRSALLSACDRDLAALERGLERFRGSGRDSVVPSKPVEFSPGDPEPIGAPMRRSG